MKTFLGIAVIAVVVAVALFLREGSDAPEKRAEAATRQAPASAAPAAPVAVPVVMPTPAQLPKAPVPAAKKPSDLMVEFLAARNLKDIFERLNAKADRTPEENYALAEIMMRCGKATDKIGLPYRPRFGGDERRAQFMEALSSKDPQREQRIAAFDQVNHDPCVGLESMTATQANVRSLVQAASAAGDPKARALQVMYDLRDQMRPDPKQPGPRSMNISDAQLDTLRSVLSSDDPLAVTQAAQVLRMGIANLSVRAGPGETTLDQNAFNFAAQFVACDLGNPCGRDSPALLQACALQGNCAAADFREHAYYYNLSPSSVQTMNEYYAQLQRARAGDWSYFTFSRGPTPATAAFTTPRK